MSIPQAEAMLQQLGLPDEALAVLDESEAQGLRFLADHPNLNVLIHFSAHREAIDLGDNTYFEELLGKADVYAQENDGYDPTEAQIILDIFSKGRIEATAVPRALELAGNSFEARQLKSIHETGVVAFPADISSGHALANQEPSTGQLFDALAMPDATEAMKDSLGKLIAERENAREWVILADLGHKLSELAISDPMVNDKLQNDQLNVFMTYGSMHTGLFHKLKRLGIHPERTFPHKPFVYPALTALIRKEMLKKS